MRDNSSTMVQVNYEQLVSRADLIYDQPVTRSEAGLPIGNGRMGTLVWTTPSALRMQINRVDVYANNSTTNSFMRHQDYCSGCGYVDVDLVDFGADVFPSDNTWQRLSVYDGLITVQGLDVEAQILAHNELDIIAVHVTDKRKQPMPIKVNLRMLRYLTPFVSGKNDALRRTHTAVVLTKNHEAYSKLDLQDGNIILTQTFVEADYSCRSAVVIGIQGRNTKAKLVNESEVRLSAEPKPGDFTILIASASSFDCNENIVKKAVSQLKSAMEMKFNRLLESNQRWWHQFWPKSFVHLQSADGVAEVVEQHYTYFLYLMASTSRGKYPPKFNGMLWNTSGDLRMWGAQHWWNNISLYYKTPPAANHLELMNPLFEMYSGMSDACAQAARQQWGSQGIFIPETVFFDGLPQMPEDIAPEMRQLYLFRQPWQEKSKPFVQYAESKHPHSSRWNWKGQGYWENGRWRYPEKEAAPHAEVLHLFGSMARLGYEYWLRYEYTLDKEWLCDKAYPMLKGIAEFFRHYPNLGKAEDGNYHIYKVNHSEGLRGATDTMEAIAGMRGILPITIKASEILAVDEPMRPLWQELQDNLAPLPRSDNPNALIKSKPGEPVFWVSGLEPAAVGRGGIDVSPLSFFDLCTMETKEANPEQFSTGQTSYDLIYPHGVDENTQVASMSGIAAVAARLGRAEDVKTLIPNQITNPRTDYCDFKGSGEELILANRMAPREGPGALDAERLGNASYAVQQALCQSVPPGPGKAPVIRVFPATPKEWDADFTLLCRGGFLVTASQKEGVIEFVEINSQLGGECRLRNPWGTARVDIYDNGRKWNTTNETVIIFETVTGNSYVIVRNGTTPEQFKRDIP